MQLDRTHVVIRLRTLSEIGDLAMVMIRRYPSSLLIGFAAGAVPWAIANALLLSWIPVNEAAYGLDDEEAVAEIARYMCWMALLVFLQAPVAGVFTTVYLGQAVFEHRPTWSTVFREGRRQFWRCFWVLCCKRWVVPTMVLLAFRWGRPLATFWDVILPIAIAIAVSVVRSSRPFVPEIVLLEQCPLRSKSSTVITLSRRSKSLHRPMSSELGGRFLAVAFLSSGLLLSVLYTLMWSRGIAFGRWDFMNLTVLILLYPLALWIIAGVSVLVRLLSYLDTRIRLEGWEVELAIRAEAMRQFGDQQDNLPPQSTATTSTATTSTATTSTATTTTAATTTATTTTATTTSATTTGGATTGGEGPGDPDRETSNSAASTSSISSTLEPGR